MDVLKQAWSIHIQGTAMYRLAKKLQHAKHVLKAWNFQHFGKAEDQVVCKRDQLLAAQVALQRTPLDRLAIANEREDKFQYAEALKQEEEILRQKARMNWLHEGDKCTKFFYTQFAARKSNKTLRKVVLPDGTELEEAREVQHYMVEYYKTLLNKETNQPLPKLSATRKLTEEDNRSLCAEITVEETADNLKQMKGDSSPGPDGLTVGFFQHCWEVVRDDLISAVQEFFNSGKLL
ncbi:hypothetical protein QJS04_geneDACA002664 [Acorus gramineus]|uniref:Reverse transcriptase n=1 Tax=Acorus gramineus TaxID=55184 RepID=A0AAV9AUA8_ACOGR|nr:hypothetical protein QJS04_geneDACA002664 [Acorus gramineus]